MLRGTRSHNCVLASSHAFEDEMLPLTVQQAVLQCSTRSATVVKIVQLKSATNKVSCLHADHMATPEGQLHRMAFLES